MHPKLTKRLPPHSAARSTEILIQFQGEGAQVCTTTICLPIPMFCSTRETRREQYDDADGHGFLDVEAGGKLTFAGTIDCAFDLQAYSGRAWMKAPERPTGTAKGAPSATWTSTPARLSFLPGWASMIRRGPMAVDEKKSQREA